MMPNICCIGHLTLDKIITSQATTYQPGGTSWYFSNALRNLPVGYRLVTALAPAQMQYADDLRQQGIAVDVVSSQHTVYFENNYTGNMDQRTQRVLQKADPFTLQNLPPITADVIHLGPLLADDFAANVIPHLAKTATLSLDVQGFLREVHNQQVAPTDWPQKRELLQYIDIVKADDRELAVLTAQPDPREGARILADWGVKEVVITFASRGSMLYHQGHFHTIPAFIPPGGATDTTGCGDTYMAGYLYQRALGSLVPTAATYAAAMAGLKTTRMGAFNGTDGEVRAFGEMCGVV